MQDYLDFHVQGYGNLGNADARWPMVCKPSGSILTRICLECLGLAQGCIECTVKNVFKLPRLTFHLRLTFPFHVEERFLRKNKPTSCSLTMLPCSVFELVQTSFPSKETSSSQSSQRGRAPSITLSITLRFLQLPLSPGRLLAATR